MSHLEELVPTTKTLHNNSPTFTETNYLLLNAKNLADSDIDISFKSISEAENVDKITKDVKTDTFAKTDSLTQSDRPSDGYETCLDESLSEDNRNSIKSKPMWKLRETESSFDTNIVQTSNTKSVRSISATYDIDDLTPTNSRVNILTDQFFHEVPDSNGHSYKPTGKIITIIVGPFSSSCLASFRKVLCYLTLPPFLTYANV